MAKVAEGMARVVHGIESGRRQRSELAAEIKVTTRRRHGDVQSFLKNLKTERINATRAQAAAGKKERQELHSDVHSLLRGLKSSRIKATREQAADGKKERQELHSDVHSLLRGLKSSRTKANREDHKEAVEINIERQHKVQSLLGQFASEIVEQREHREAAGQAQRKEAAVFMKDLTGSVDAFRDKLAKEGRDRAAEIRARLADYARDRREGMVIWRGNFKTSRPAASTDSYAHHRPAAEPPASAAAHAKPHEAPGAAAKPAAENAVPAGAHVKAQAPVFAAKQAPSSKQPAGNPDHRGPQGGHKGHSK
jgi:hypothetical protein